MKNINFNFLKENFINKNVFITGHTGFKGSWLAFILSEAGANVTGYALAPIEKENHFDMLNLKKKINHIDGDIRDFKKLVSSIENSSPEYVFHLAAQALVKPSYEKPTETFETNIIGSVNLLESVRICKSVQSLVYVTSDKCYENVEWIWGYRENDILGGIDPYSASKAAAELVFSSYQRSFFYSKANFGAASARAGNVIGGGDWSKYRIIPDCIKAVKNKENLKLRNPNSTRPWQHVLEPLSGYLQLAVALKANPKKFSGSWNFGPKSSDVKSVKDIAEGLLKFFNKSQIEIEDNIQNNSHEANLLQLNCDKANLDLKWSPRWKFEKTIDETAKWYKFVMDGSSAIEITKKQMIEYFS